jgi:hypothetical protein
VRSPFYVTHLAARIPAIETVHCRLVHETKDRALEAAALGSLGNAYRLRGDYTQAINYIVLVDCSVFAKVNFCYVALVSLVLSLVFSQDIYY